MATILVNDAYYHPETDMNLLRFLRDELKLTSVKDGCSEGACGTCMVLVDGAPKKACVLTTLKLDGKKVETVEGFTAREREVYAHAFAIAGAVQCGFCTPGMMISAKALLNQTLSPTRAQIKKAIRNNLCRCTGYKKIEDAILLAAQLLREDKPVPALTGTGKLGERAQRVDAIEKALGTAVYTDDIVMENMLYGGAKRSAYPRARVLAIHTQRAAALPGVHAVLTAADIPGAIKIGHIKKDWDVLIGVGECTRYLGDAIALAAAEDKQTLQRALELIEVEYEELPAIFSPIDAMADDAPPLHPGGNLLFEQRLSRGDADTAIANSKHVVTEHYSVPFTEHAYLEPECAVAYPEDEGVCVVSADQGVYQTRGEVADMLWLPLERVRIRAAMVGGAFGGKEDMSVQHHAALLAHHTKRPVKVKLSRAESMQVHPKRHAMEIDYTTACDENGMLTAMKAVIIADSGAYASLGGPVLQRACTHGAGPYHYHHVEILGRAYYTNNPPGGAFRGFGVPQSCFAAECNLNKLAALVGISPFEIRYRNAIRPGQTLPNGQIADESTALVETLDAIRPYYEANPRAGLACALKNSGVGVGIPDTGRCRIDIRGGRAHLYSSAACVGQGMGTVQLQLLCETAGLSPEEAVWERPDTALSENAGNTTASRQTVFTGEAVVRAARALREALRTYGSLDVLNGQSFHGEFTAFTDAIGVNKKNPVSHVNYGYATQLVELDENGLVSRVIAAHDVGRAINPTMLEGQIEGGVVMSLGYALTEDFPLTNGRPTKKFAGLGLFRADKAPDVVSIIVEKSIEGPAYGAKGVGEISSIPTAPAVQLAYENFDGRFRTKLPLEGTAYSK